MRIQEPLSMQEALNEFMNRLTWPAHIPKPPKNPTHLSIKVTIPGEAIPANIFMHQCGSCGLICGIEEGVAANCPYCGGDKLMEMEG